MPTFSGIGFKGRLLAGLLFLDVAILALNAEALPSPTSRQYSQCQASLKKLKPYLKQCVKERPAQDYYKDLYQQIKAFLHSSENFPSTSSQADSCHNLLQIIKDITGKPFSQELPPMPQNFNPTEGKLASPVLSSLAKRDMHPKRIRYAIEGESLKRSVAGDEEADAAEEFYSGPSLCLPVSKKGKPAFIPEFNEGE